MILLISRHTTQYFTVEYIVELTVHLSEQSSATECIFVDVDTKEILKMCGSRKAIQERVDNH